MSAPSTPSRADYYPSSAKPSYVIGVCAMEVKSRSKPMRNILDRLLASNSHPTNPVNFEIVLFNDQLILNEPISQWPACDALVAFYSMGFPLEKAIAYQRSRGMFCVNDLVMQYVLQDRRLVQLILEAIDVPIPRRIWLNCPNDAPPSIPPQLNEIVSRDFNVDLSSPQLFKTANEQGFHEFDGETLRIGREEMRRPFIEKPASADDHNIWIYQADGQVCRLFRKIENKCSERVSGQHVNWRGSLGEQSFVYEQFLPVDGGEDIKVYTVGPNFAYAESRKSPFVDGIVRRNAQGKEIRSVATLTEEEQEIARRVCMAFGQTVCGFDMIRCDGRPYVIDINGWSFVKGSEVYYDKAAKILKDTFIQIARRRRRHSLLTASPSLQALACAPLEKDNNLLGQWRLKAYVGVFRHADRTPKQKIKVYTRNPQIWGLYERKCLDQHDKLEVMLRSQNDLEEIRSICEENAAAETGVDCRAKSQAATPSLEPILQVLRKKIKIPGTKVQIRRYDPRGDPECLLLILKWGGEFTHAGRHQSKDAGENLRKDLLILNKRILDDVRVYSSAERRVQATAQVFSKSFFPIAELPDNFINISEDILDDHLVEKKLFDSVKDRMKSKFSKSPLVSDILEALKRHRQLLNENFGKSGVIEESMTRRWCCSESPLLFKERWDKHFQEVVETEDCDLSRICDLYDSIRYDAIHHRKFLISMFVGAAEDSSAASYQANHESLVKLFDDLHRVFRLLTPLEYGFSRGERLRLSKQISGKLLKRLMEDLQEAICGEDVRGASVSGDPFVRLYFTKETHMHALLNLIKYSGIPLNQRGNPSSSFNSHECGGNGGRTPNPAKAEFSQMFNSNDSLAECGFMLENGLESCEYSLNDAHEGGEEEMDLDYLSQVCFEFYERVQSEEGSECGVRRSYSLRIGVSSGANDAHLFDLQLDAKHAVTVKGRSWITEYLDGNQILSWLHALIGE